MSRSPFSRANSSDHKYPIRWFEIRGASGLISHRRHIHHPLSVWLLLPLFSVDVGLEIRLHDSERAHVCIVCMQLSCGRRNDEKPKWWCDIAREMHLLAWDTFFSSASLTLTWSTFDVECNRVVICNRGKMQTLVSRFLYCMLTTFVRRLAITVRVPLPAMLASSPLPFQNQYNCHQMQNI